MSGFVRACASSRLAEGTACALEIGGRRLALARVEGRVYAIDGVCPHRGGELGSGDLSGHHLYCPQHAWAFDVRDGQAFFPRGAKVACFPAKEEGEEVQVDLTSAPAAPAWRPPFETDT